MKRATRRDATRRRPLNGDVLLARGEKLLLYREKERKREKERETGDSLAAFIVT